MDTVKTETFSMDYIRFGSGERTFVILPGLSVQSVMGAANAVADAYRIIADDFTVYLFDRRKELPESYSVRDMAADTAAALQALGLERVNLFGASQGGMIAMEIAAMHPEMVEKLVLGSTAARITDEGFQVIERWIRLAKEKNPEGLYLDFGEAVYPAAIFEQSRGLLIDAAKTVTEAELERFITLAEGMKGFDITDDLKTISCPVLVLGDKDDRVLGGSASEEIIGYLTGSPDPELYMYESYGHASYDTAPDYKVRILNFLLPAAQN